MPRTKGTKHPLAFLTESQVRDIRNAYNCGVTQRSIAETYGISRQQIGKIVRALEYDKAAEAEYEVKPIDQ